MTDPAADVTPPPGPDARIGGRFRLVRRLAHGGMGTVWEAHDEELDRPVAVKMLRDAEDPTARERFHREARVAATLSHPNVVSIYDTGVEDGHHYLVLELVHGRDLASLLADEGPFPLERAVRTVEQICDALAHAHAAGVIHRDIKPGNILVERGGRVRVTDFGIAHLVDAARVTATGPMLGTARYCAPEQIAGEPTGPATDIYALGLVLYELLTGRAAYDGEHPAGVALRRLHEPVPPPSRTRPDVPASLDAVVATATARAPGDRYPDATAFRDAVAAALEGAVDEWTTRPLPADATMAMPATGDPAGDGWGQLRDRVERLPRGAVPVAVLAALLAVTLPYSQRQASQPEPTAPPTPAAATSQAPAAPEATSPPATPIPEATGTAPSDDVAAAPEEAFQITPAIIGLDAGSVADELRRNGFQVEVRERASDRPAGTVVDVEPTVGAHVRPGDTIILHAAG